jgi:hypothetical protein
MPAKARGAAPMSKGTRIAWISMRVIFMAFPSRRSSGRMRHP